VKRTKQCPKCHSLDVGYLERMLDYTTLGPVAQHLAQRVDNEGVVGQIEVYVCTGCGFLESYVRDHELMDFGQLSGFRFLNARDAKTTPYR
jgi:predicted nucleic-acid-binding Zn-ribbon protein